MKDISKAIVAALASVVMCWVFFIAGRYSCPHSDLTKEIDRLKPYEEMYKVMADSVGNIHGKCFRIN